MFKFGKFFPLILLFSTFVATGQHIVGYLPQYRVGQVENIDFSKLTRLYIAFANPDMEGNLSFDGTDVSPIIEKAKEQNIELLVSVAGGYLAPAWEEAWEHHQLPENRSAFIHQLMEFTEDHGFAGIDLDLEWGHVGPNYSGFALELRDSLTAHGKLLTAALPATTRFEHINDEALKAFDFINIMAYDLTGSWTPNNPGPHSPMNFAQQSITFWKNQGVPAEKLLLGVPFYGYDFTDRNNIRGVAFRDIIARDPSLAEVDADGEIYYNGRATIRDKTRMAITQTAGVMIWELGQDSYDEYSLLSVVYNTIHPLSTNLSLDLDLSIYPNPTTDNFRIISKRENLFQLFDLKGALIWEEKGKDLKIDMTQEPSGVYVLSAGKNGSRGFTLIKK